MSEREQRAAAPGTALAGIDLDRCDSSGYFMDGLKDCTFDNPCRIHAIVKALHPFGMPLPKFWGSSGNSPSPSSSSQAPGVSGSQKLTKEQWVERYGGQSVLDAEGFDVVPCEHCDDTICHGWRVVPKAATPVQECQQYAGKLNKPLPDGVVETPTGDNQTGDLSSYRQYLGAAKAEAQRLAAEAGGGQLAMNAECGYRKALEPLRSKLARLASGHDGYIYGAILEDLNKWLSAPCGCHAEIERLKTFIKQHSTAELTQWALSQPDLDASKPLAEALKGLVERLRAELQTLHVTLLLSTSGAFSEDATDEDRLDWLAHNYCSATERAEAAEQSLAALQSDHTGTL